MLVFQATKSRQDYNGRFQFEVKLLLALLSLAYYEVALFLCLPSFFQVSLGDFHTRVV